MADITCKRCIMTSHGDPLISFDSNGLCNYCTNALLEMEKGYFPNDEGKKKLDNLLERIKANGKQAKYDCIMGISGGLDSSYLLYLGHKWGLRILAVHISDGFDTDVSKSNIKKLIDATGFDYLEVIPDKEQYANITKAYMRAGVPNIAIPQDNILFTELHRLMRAYNVNCFLSGANYALESILQKGNTHGAYDYVQIKDIFRKCGSGKIDKLKFMSTKDLLADQYVRHYVTYRPLDYVDYRRDKAFKELYDFCRYEYYGRKHLENMFTAFVQLYWLPKKFNVDKRTSHLSSMIISGQISREEALQEMTEPIYDEEMMQRYIEVIKKELCISDSEFAEMMNEKAHSHEEYRQEKNTIGYKFYQQVWRIIKKIRGIK